MYDVAVIGGGASGMTAAIVCARRGLNVIIFEKYERLGRKLLATGNGKCNILPAVMDIGKYNTSDILPVLKRFGVAEITSFFEGLGLVLREEEGRLFPYSCQASSVQNAMRAEVKKLNITVASATVITAIRGKQPFKLYYDEGETEARNVILASGSTAGFGLDSTGLLAPYRHSCIERRPSLVPFLTDMEYIKGLKGVRVNADVILNIDGKFAAREYNEVIFKDNGVSGSAIFDLSVTLARRGRFRGAEVVIDFVPDMTEEKLSGIIQTRLDAGQELDGLLHKEIIANIIKRAGRARGSLAEKIAKLTKNYSIRITSLGNRELAQVMCGGLKLDEFDLATMQSLKQVGLYAVGESLNVDGECGGYNLMWAWASAMTAGASVN